MTEGFLSRWSRLKRNADEVPATSEPAQETPTEDATEGATAQAKTRTQAHKAKSDQPQPLDLPSIEEITAETDVRGFLQKGVPSDLRQAALRRAWAADPAIRDFVGLSENAYDFNDPHGVPGFGPLKATAEVACMVDRIVGRSLLEAAGDPSEALGTQAAGLSESPENDPKSGGESSPQELPAQFHEHAANLQDLVVTDFPADFDLAQKSSEDVAVQNQSKTDPPLEKSVRRGHGGALPK